MAVGLTGVIVDCADPASLSRFWSVALGYESHAEGDLAWLDVPEGEVGIAFQRVAEPKVAKNRLHLDLTPVGASQEQELARLLEAGAERISVGEPVDASWFVLADPEGNEFCLLAADE